MFETINEFDGDIILLTRREYDRLIGKFARWADRWADRHDCDSAYEAADAAYEHFRTKENWGENLLRFAWDEYIQSYC